MRRQLMLAVAVAGTMLVAGTARGQFWTRIGLDEPDVQMRLINVFAEGELNAPSLPALRALPAAARGALIDEMASYARRYVRTPEFARRYAEIRESRKPEAPDEVMTGAERRAHDRAQVMAAMAQMDSAVRMLPPAQQAAVRELQQQQRDVLRGVEDPANPRYSAATDAQNRIDHADEIAAYNKAVREWETRYPAAPAAGVRNALREFLALSVAVDFAAKTARNSSGVTIFVDPDVEGKSPAWKALFRAGRETTTALRAAAQQWLDELPR